MKEKISDLVDDIRRSPTNVLAMGRTIMANERTLSYACIGSALCLGDKKIQKQQQTLEECPCGDEVIFGRGEVRDGRRY
jgi:hypothetical protein